MTKPTYLRPTDAAAYLSVSRATIYNLLKKGTLKSSLVNKMRLIRVSDLDLMIESFSTPSSICSEVGCHPTQSK